MSSASDGLHPPPRFPTGASPLDAKGDFRPPDFCGVQKILKLYCGTEWRRKFKTRRKKDMGDPNPFGGRKLKGQHNHAD